MNRTNEFHKAWNWLNSHPMYEPDPMCPISGFMTCLHVMVAKVDPDTRKIEDKPSRNTRVEVWLESGPPVFTKEMGWVHAHDIDLDCGASTFEKAVIKLAALVLKYYGNYAESYRETTFMKKKIEVAEEICWKFADSDTFGGAKPKPSDKDSKCSEMLLVTIKKGKKAIVYPEFVCYRYETQEWVSLCGIPLKEKVVSWMEIPQPPKYRKTD